MGERKGTDSEKKAREKAASTAGSKVHGIIQYFVFASSRTVVVAASIHPSHQSVSQWNGKKTLSGFSEVGFRDEVVGFEFAKFVVAGLLEQHVQPQSRWILCRSVLPRQSSTFSSRMVMNGWMEAGRKK